MEVNFKQDGSLLRVRVALHPETTESDRGVKLLDTHIRELCKQEGHVVQKLIRDNCVIADAGILEGEWVYTVETAPAPQPKPAPKRAAPKPKLEAERFGKKPFAAKQKTRNLQK